MNEKPFVTLDVPPARIEDGFRLDTELLEIEMYDHNGGVDLARVDPGKTLDDSFYRKFVPYFVTDRCDPDMEKMKAITEKFPYIKGPCAMKVDSAEELSRHMANVYQIAHIHYILGKKHRLKGGKFPLWCCGLSTDNNVLSDISIGYVNAAHAYSQEGGHNYGVLPFVFGEREIPGVIVVDSTSDQIDKGRQRNEVFLKFGLNWKYVVKGNDIRGNLFPSTVASVDSYRKYSLAERSGPRYSARNFFRQAYSCPIKLEALSKQ